MTHGLCSDALFLSAFSSSLLLSERAHVVAHICLFFLFILHSVASVGSLLFPFTLYETGFYVSATTTHFVNEMATRMILGRNFYPRALDEGFGG
jgi:hypothetical protein